MKKTLIMILLGIVLIASVNNVYAECTYLNNATLQSYYRAEDTTDEMGNWDVTFTGVTVTSSNCINNNCWNSDATNDYSSAGDVTYFDTSTNQLSVSLWANNNDLTVNEAMIFDKYDQGTNTGFNMRYTNGNNDITFGFRGVGSANTLFCRTNGDFITEGVTHHIVVTYDGDDTTCGSIKIYIDGTARTITTDASDNPDNDLSNNDPALFFARNDAISTYNMNGQIDEVGIWNAHLKPTDVTNLYNGGAFCDPSVTAGSVTINTPLVDNTNSTNNPFQFEWNGSVVDTPDVFNCSFVVNEVIEDTLTNIAINDTNRLFNFSNGNGYYNMSVDCYNNESVTNNVTVSNLFIDTVQPLINIVSGLTNNSIIEKRDGIDLVVNYSDIHLEAINFTIYRLNTDDSIDILVNNTFIDGILTDRYTLNFSDDFFNPNWMNAKDYALVLSAWDGHTDNALRYTPLVINNVLRYGGLSFYCDDTDEMNFIELHDRIQPVINFKTPRKQQKCYYETTGEFKKVNRPDFPIWYIDLQNRFWLDEKDGNFESDLISPQRLQIRLNFDRNTDYFISESFGDLNFNTQTYFFTIDSFTTYFANKVNVTATTISGTDWQLVSNNSFNLTGTRDLFSKLSLNSVKTVVAGSNDLFVNMSIDGTEVFSGKLRTMTGTNIGVSGFFANYTQTIGNHNLELFFRETGTGNVDISNIDFTILGFETQNNETICNVIKEKGVVSFSNTEFQPVFNFSTNEYDSNNILQQQYSVNATGEDEITLYIFDNDDGENSTIVQRYISGATDTGSLFNPFFDLGINTNKNYSIMAKGKNGNTINLDYTILGLCMQTINGSKIQTVTESNESTDRFNNLTLTAGQHRLISLPIELKNGTSVFIESSFTFKSESGAQTPLFNISTVDGKCALIKERSLSDNSDIGNAFMTCVANSFTVGDTKTFNVDVTVGTGETLTMIDEVLVVFETTALDLTEQNLPPTVVISEDISNITNGVDATFNAIATDLNLDSLNVTAQWYVNGALVFTETQNSVSSQELTFTLSSGLFTTGQFVNATVIAFDQTINSTPVFTSTVEVSEDISVADQQIINLLTDIWGEIRMMALIIGLFALMIFTIYLAMRNEMYYLYGITGIISAMIGGLVSVNMNVDREKLIVFGFFMALGLAFWVMGGALTIGQSFSGNVEEENKSVYGKIYNRKK